MRQTSGKGAMAVVELTMDEAAARLVAHGGRVSVAVNNGPRSTVISGDPAPIAALLGDLEREGVFCRQIKVDVASHSPQMDPLVPALVASQSGLAPRAVVIPLYSTVDAVRVDGPELVAEYWGRNLRQPVLFGQTIDTMLADGVDAFIEMSPHPALLGAIRQAGEARGHDLLALHSLRREEPERLSLLVAMGELFAAGHPVDWRRLFPDGYSRTDLPRYPWQRERHWLDVRPASTATRQRGGGFLESHMVSSTEGDTHFWQASISVAARPYLGDHRVNGLVVLPAAGFLEMALEAAAELVGQRGA
jgi:acyl transferase domain-containing protein